MFPESLAGILEPKSAGALGKHWDCCGMMLLPRILKEFLELKTPVRNHF